MESNVITVPPISTQEAQNAASEASKYAGRANGLVVVDQRSYEAAGKLLGDVKSRMASLEKRRKEITGPLDMAKKSIMNLFRVPMDCLAKIERDLKAKIVKYSDEQEAARLKEEQRLQAIADEKARKEREALEKRANKAAEKGNTEKAGMLKEQAEAVSAPVVAVAPKVEAPSNISYRDEWYAEVINKSKVPEEYKVVDVAMLNKLAKATKGAILVPGVQFKSKKISVVRGV